jgi:glycosyltransferase involved in cell wall biosynthesis
MKILFLTISRINGISDRGIYSDLMRKFCDEGHDVFITTPIERRYKQRATLIKRNKIVILKIRTLNIQKSNALEKWLAVLIINYQFLRGIKRFFSEIKFDLVMYSTPPITFTMLVNYIKQKDGAISYLLLKDIFPQNAVDLGLIKKGGLLHKYFLKKEKKLYEISDYIGCMSQASVAYILKHNPEIKPDKVEVNPNSHGPLETNITQEQKSLIRQHYNIPSDAIVFIYGGNLGKPQGVDFIIEFLNSRKEETGIFFLVVGSGTEYFKIDSWFRLKQPQNALLLSELPKHEYDLLLQSCDIGMIFLDSRFTIPNFPSRLLSYLECKMPVIAATDKNTDIGKIMEEYNFGIWSEAGNLQALNQNISKLSNNPELRKKMGQNGYEHLLRNYTVDTSYCIINKHFNNV